MSYIIEDNFVLKMFPFANFKTFHGGKNDWTIIKIKTKIIKIIFNVEEETDCGATLDEMHASVDATSQNAGETRGTCFYARKIVPAGRPIDRFLNSRCGFDLPRDPAPLQRPLSSRD